MHKTTPHQRFKSTMSTTILCLLSNMADFTFNQAGLKKTGKKRIAFTPEFDPYHSKIHLVGIAICKELLRDTQDGVLGSLRNMSEL